MTTKKPKSSTRTAKNKVSRQVGVEFFDTGYAPLVRHPQTPLAALNQFYEDGSDTGDHRHTDFYALFITTSGRAIHVINGQAHAAQRGDVYITPPGSVHAYRNFRSFHAETFCFQESYFSLHEIEALHSLRGFRDLLVANDTANNAHHCLHLTPEQLGEVEKIVAEMNRELSSEETFIAPLLARGLFFRLLVFLARLVSTSSTRTVENARPDALALALRDILRVCETRFHEPLSVPQLAKLIGFSTAHFSEVFKAETGLAPATYIRRLRLQRAQKLLQTTKLSSSQIALQCGFSDGAQLARTFRREFDMTPRQLRSGKQP